MKKLLFIHAIAAIYIGLCSTVMADLTPTKTGLPKPKSHGTYTVKHGSEDSDVFAEDCLYWLLDDVFGWDRRHRGSRYYYGHDNLGLDSANGSWAYGHGDDAWSFGSGDGGWGCDSTDTCPPRPVPVPGTFLLGTLGLSLAGWRLRRHKES